MDLLELSDRIAAHVAAIHPPLCKVQPRSHLTQTPYPHSKATDNDMLRYHRGSSTISMTVISKLLGRRKVTCCREAAAQLLQSRYGGGGGGDFGSALNLALILTSQGPGRRKVKKNEPRCKRHPIVLISSSRHSCAIRHLDPTTRRTRYGDTARRFDTFCFLRVRVSD